MHLSNQFGFTLCYGQVIGIYESGSDPGLIKHGFSLVSGSPGTDQIPSGSSGSSGFPGSPGPGSPGFPGSSGSGLPGGSVRL